jgi:hypothetical protein
MLVTTMLEQILDKSRHKATGLRATDTLKECTGAANGMLHTSDFLAATVLAVWIEVHGVVVKCLHVLIGNAAATAINAKGSDCKIVLSFNESDIVVVGDWTGERGGNECCYDDELHVSGILRS